MLRRAEQERQCLEGEVGGARMAAAGQELRWEGGRGQAAWVNEILSLFPFEATWDVTDPHVKIIGMVLS